MFVFIFQILTKKNFKIVQRLRGSQKSVDENDLTKRGNYEFITYNTLSNRIDNMSVATRNILSLSPDNETMLVNGYCVIGHVVYHQLHKTR